MRISWGFCRNWFRIDPLHYLSRRTDFRFEFAEIFEIEKRLPDSASRGVGFWMLKKNSSSHQLPDLPSRGVAMVRRGVAIRI